ncbi:MAG: prephenate dehydratase domain-containing protein [Lachnospiraceae bacterium]|nr:prephenate dehydratase domain-containing protein [Lachnospiraceae bacterium]
MSEVLSGYEILDSTAIFPAGGNIACQGVKGAYSNLAARKMFTRGNYVFFKTFQGVADAVMSGFCDFGMLPIENNNHGSVKAVYQILEKGQLNIVRSETMLITHQLLAKPGTKLEDIRRVYSHEQALGQCSGFLKSLGDQVRTMPCLNTALAARHVAESEERDIAAVSSPECAQLYGLVPLADHIADSDNNHTRFVCVSRKPVVYPGANRISLILSVSHKPGSLYEVLGEFVRLGINMVKLESTPVQGRDFEFRFYIDIEASTADEQVRQMLDRLKGMCPEFVFLGNYSVV